MAKRGATGVAEVEAPVSDVNSRLHQNALQEAGSPEIYPQAYAAVNTDPRAEEESEIARIAYEMFEARGREHGRHDDDWYEAEKEFRRRKGEQDNNAGLQQAPAAKSVHPAR